MTFAQAPLIGQYWPIIMGGFVAYVVAKILLPLVMSNRREASNDWTTKINQEIEKLKRNIAEEESKLTPDQLADLEKEVNLDDDNISERNINSEKKMLTPALPEDTAHVLFEFTKLPQEQSIQRAKDFYCFMNTRRTIRMFSTEMVNPDIIRYIVRAAGTAPSGAHTEPWTYVVVSDAAIKGQIRNIVEEEEEINYSRRMGEKWITDLKPLKTNWSKPYLTEAPYIILVFKQIYGFTENGEKKIHYYNEMSVSIAAGFLLAAIHYAGLVGLTSTPLNCGPALRSLLGRPNNEKLALLIPVGYPAENATVPDLVRKPLEEIIVEI